jgi:hypothetical protein
MKTKKEGRAEKVYFVFFNVKGKGCIQARKVPKHRAIFLNRELTQREQNCLYLHVVADIGLLISMPIDLETGNLSPEVYSVENQVSGDCYFFSRNKGICENVLRAYHCGQWLASAEPSYDRQLKVRAVLQTMADRKRLYYSALVKGIWDQCPPEKAKSLEDSLENFRRRYLSCTKPESLVKESPENPGKLPPPFAKEE